MTGRILEAQRKLTTSFDPIEDARPARRSHPLSSDRIERGAMAIYGVVTRTDDPNKLAEKWARTARPIAKDRHRAEAEAVIRAVF